MGYAKAIVTIVLGEKYLTTWRRVCEANWHAYAQKHGYELSASMPRWMRPSGPANGPRRGRSA